MFSGVKRISKVSKLLVSEWVEKDHPRGQPDNSGQFAAKPFKSGNVVEGVPGQFGGKNFRIRDISPNGHLNVDALDTHNNVTKTYYDVPPHNFIETEIEPEVIKVGGDVWNRMTAIRLEREYKKSYRKLESLTQDIVSGEYDENVKEKPHLPKTWTHVPFETMDKIHTSWHNDNWGHEYDQEIENWHSSGDAFHDAKFILAYDKLDEFMKYALTFFDETTSEPEIPFTTKQLQDAIVMVEDNEHQDSNGQYDFKVQFNDHILNKVKIDEHDFDQLDLPGFEPEDYSKLLTPHMRDEISDAVHTYLNDQAEKMEYEIEPPDYFKERAEENLEDLWYELPGEDKYAYGVNMGMIEEVDDSEPQQKLDKLPDEYDPLNKTTGEDYDRTQILAKRLSTARATQLLRERKIEGLPEDDAELERIVREIDHQLWEDWKGSSSSSGGRTLQVAASEELQGKLRETDYIKRDETIKGANGEFHEIGGFEGLKAYVRAKWETSQYLLEKAGIKSLNLYRGITLPDVTSNAGAVFSIDYEYPEGVSWTDFQKNPDKKWFVKDWVHDGQKTYFDSEEEARAGFERMKEAASPSKDKNHPHYIEEVTVGGPELIRKVNKGGGVWNVDGLLFHDEKAADEEVEKLNNKLFPKKEYVAKPFNGKWGIFADSDSNMVVLYANSEEDAQKKIKMLQGGPKESKYQYGQYPGGGWWIKDTTKTIGEDSVGYGDTEEEVKQKIDKWENRLPKGFVHKKLPNKRIIRNGLASTSTDPSIANNWDGDDQVTLRAVVPRTAVVSIPAYGVNVHSEHEVVVAGVSWCGWDAWLGKCPTLEEYPMTTYNEQIGPFHKSSYIKGRNGYIDFEDLI